MDWGIQIVISSHSLQVQVVIYENDETSLLHSAKFTIAAIREAVTKFNLVAAKLAFGDCSENPAISKGNIKKLETWCKSEGIKFSYEHFKANLGSAGGHNRLAESASSSLLLISNPDVVVQPDAISELILKLSSDEKAGVADAKQLPIEHPKVFDLKSLETSWCSMAFALTYREIFNQVGGFDAKTFFLYCDDVDYSWRVRMAGFRPIYVPSAIVFHDKTLDSQARWVPTASEDYFSAEAALLLTYKWSRLDLTNAIIKIFQESNSATYAKALETFNHRAATGALPEQVDPNNKVGTFVKGNYAKHRF